MLADEVRVLWQCHSLELLMRGSAFARLLLQLCKLSLLGHFADSKHFLVSVNVALTFWNSLQLRLDGHPRALLRHGHARTLPRTVERLLRHPHGATALERSTIRLSRGLMCTLILIEVFGNARALLGHLRLICRKS